MALQDETLWAGGRDGVWKIDINSGKALMELKCDHPLSYVRSLVIDDIGRLWIAHFKGLASFDSSGCVTYGKDDGLPDERVNALYLDNAGALWVGTWSGAAIYNGKGFTAYAPTNGLVDAMVNVIMQDSTGGMWFGSYTAPAGGLSYCADNSCRHFTVKEGLPHNSITSILETTPGEMWVGTGFLDRGGAARFTFTDGAWALSGTLSAGQGLAGEKVRSIYKDNNGALWYGSEYDGIAINRNGSWKIITVSDGLSDNEVKVMLADKYGALWMGTRDGITKISKHELEGMHIH